MLQRNRMKQCDNWGTFAKVAHKPFTILRTNKRDIDTLSFNKLILLLYLYFKSMSQKLYML